MTWPGSTVGLCMAVSYRAPARDVRARDWIELVLVPDVGKRHEVVDVDVA